MWGGGQKKRPPGEHDERFAPAANTCPWAGRSKGWCEFCPLSSETVYSQMTFSGVDWTIQHGVQPNAAILNTLRVDALNCPSSGMATDRSDDDGTGNTFRYQLVNYVGIGAPDCKVRTSPTTRRRATKDTAAEGRATTG